MSHGAILLVIKNFGASTAADVRVRFDPPAPGTEALAGLPESDIAKWLYQRFADAVPVWAPDWSTSNVIRAGQDPLGPFTVILSYLGPDSTRYEERFHSVPNTS